MAILDQENKNLISSCKFFSILGHQTLDPESGSAIRKNAGSGSVSGSALNQCGSETLSSPLQFHAVFLTLLKDNSCPLISGDNVEVDYRGYEVTVENLVRLLTGRLPATVPRCTFFLSY
jgi:hypothetical protein